MSDTMNIYAKKGDKVRFLNANGYDFEPKQAVERGLTEGEVYTVDRTYVYNFTSDVVLQEFPDHRFNTVMFEDVNP